MKIALYTNTPKIINGCRKMTLNLFKGLDELGVDWVENQPGDKTGALHGAIKELQKMELPKDTLVGCEIVVLPSETNLFQYYKNWCQPSLWVINYMKTFKQCENINMYVWPVGVDHEEFKPDKQMTEQECFIYYKNVTKQTPESRIDEAIAQCKKYGLSYKVIKYGSYIEDELKHLCNTSKFSIWLAGTESENLALMEVLSMDIPVYVIDETQFKYGIFTFDGATSAPYFDDNCGMKHKDYKRFEEFISNVNQYRPRQYILDNHTCKHGAQKYIDILRSINDTK